MIEKSVPQGIKPALELKHTLALQSELYTMAGEVSLSGGASYKIGFTSPRNIMFTLFLFRTTANRMRTRIYEGIAYTGGTTVTGTNRNRQLPKLQSVVVKAGVTATVSGPFSYALFGQNAGGEFRTEEPLILAKDTPYILEFMNDDAGGPADIMSWFMAGCELDIAIP